MLEIIKELHDKANKMHEESKSLGNTLEGVVLAARASGVLTAAEYLMDRLIEKAG